MSTAHKPTFIPARGSEHQGGFRHYAPLATYSVRDVAAHTKLKTRQTGQSTQTELKKRDLKAELLAREEEHSTKLRLEKQREGLVPFLDSAVDDSKEPKLLKSSSEKDSKEENDDTEKAAIVTVTEEELSKFDDADDEADEADEKEEKAEDDDDEVEELKRELAKIKKDREAEQLRKQKAQEELEAKSTEEAVLKGNPLLVKDSSSVKRRWDDDVVFKNQAKDMDKSLKPKAQKKLFLKATHCL
eukprot:TRINITY_DN2210_c0_g1_i1.p1 TRINITY_DN2210_c0_g1~~TRINITY_DN2210_c0_g1_i1.p1  ORF type:complete len:244 (+),score=72.39 TRINITY_DN2210_c0_g1_i1:82-813(+)